MLLYESLSYMFIDCVLKYCVDLLFQLCPTGKGLPQL